MSYEIIKMNYERGLWNIKMVANAVKKEVLTPEQFQEITGQVYPVSQS